jgi:uncharacterized membrane protein
VKEALKPWVAITVAAVIQILAGVIALQVGWGLEPKSWLAIIGVGFGGTLFSRILVTMDTPTSCPCSNCIPSDKDGE